MTRIDARVRGAILRQDLLAFIEMVFGVVNPDVEFLPNWHIQTVAWHLYPVPVSETHLGDS